MRIRKAFFAAAIPYNFTVSTVAINKEKINQYDSVFAAKNSFYKYICNMVLTNALPYLDRAIIVLDKSGSETFRGELRRYIKTRITKHDTSKIHKIKTETSSSNNLIQLADYCVGIGNRKIQDKPYWEDLYKYIAPKIVSWQEWP